MRNSAAVQFRDLAEEMVRQGHSPTVLVPSHSLRVAWSLEQMFGIQILRLHAPRTKDIGRVRRLFAEAILPYAMRRNLKKSPLGTVRWEGVVWYSPTIFFGPLVNSIRRSSKCRSYLILRDIFPEWAVNLGLMRRGLVYSCLKLIEAYQYSLADVIGVQTSSVAPYIKALNSRGLARVEVLQNWLSEQKTDSSPIIIEQTRLRGRKIFVYAGNLGAMQGVDSLLELAANLKERKDIGFLFVGRGTEKARLRNAAEKNQLDNVIFENEIEPSEIAGLYAQCHVGLVALDIRHKNDNVPGKFLSYMQSGLPVLARLNPGNDLAVLIRERKVGMAETDGTAQKLCDLALSLISQLDEDLLISQRCRILWRELYSTEIAAKQVMAALVERSRSIPLG